MRMAAGPVSEKELSDELSLHGYDGQQKTYRYFCELVTKHTGVENPRFNQQRVEKLDAFCDQLTERLGRLESCMTAAQEALKQAEKPEAAELPN